MCLLKAKLNLSFFYFFFSSFSLYWGKQDIFSQNITRKEERAKENLVVELKRIRSLLRGVFSILPDCPEQYTCGSQVK